MHSPKVTPKDFFLWAGAMVALYGSAIAFITLMFQYINYAFPDPLNTYYSDPFSSGMRFAMASLIVLVPVAILLMRLIQKDIRAESSKAELWVRRWALMLTLFVAGFTVVGDLITLINYFLGGDLTMRFVLKIVVVLLVAGAAFMHFLADLRGYWIKFPGRAQMVGYATAIAVVLTILSGFLIMGSPAQVRLIRFDFQKTNDLQNIQYQVVNYWQLKQTLPQNLSEVADPISGMNIPKDPQSGADYRYEKTGDLSFKLCANFNAENTNQMSYESTAPMYVGVENESWKHGEGEVCFDRTIDPDRHPAFQKGAPMPVR